MFSGNPVVKWILQHVAEILQHKEISSHVTECGLRNPGNFLLWNPESWVLESRITAKGIRNPTNDLNLES